MGTRAVVPVLGAVSAGIGLALQAWLNGELGARVGDGVVATLASTSAGLVLLLALVPVLPAGRRGLRLVSTAVRTAELRWWHLAGGVSGALFVAAQGISVGTIGVTVFTVAVVAGTAVGGLVVDRFWNAPGGRRPITVARTAGAAAGVAAVAIAGHGTWGHGEISLLVVLPVLAGAAVAVQTALNGRVGAVAGSPWPPTLVNFTVAAAALALAVAVGVAVHGSLPGRLPTEPLLYLAGVIGVGVITVATLAVRRIGVLVFGLASVTGQLAGAVVLDTVTPGTRPSPATYLGITVTLLALVLASADRRDER